MAMAVGEAQVRRGQHWVRWIKRWVANPQLLTLLLALDVAAYFAGLIFWYGYVMGDAATPMWVWPFVPDCPLFGWLGGLGLLMVVARDHWSAAARRQGQRWLWLAAGLALVMWGVTYVPQLGAGWHALQGTFGLLSLTLVVAAVWFREPPAWLLGVFAFGQIKYGIWTITAWVLYWRSTADVFGAPHFSVDSVTMTVAHVGLAAQGLVLLGYFRPDWRAALAVMVWFGASDFVDYGLGYYPAIPETLISLRFVQWSTITVTLLLVALFWLYAVSPRFGGTAARQERAAAGDGLRRA